MLETGDTKLTYSLQHKQHGKVNTCIQRESYSPGFNTVSRDCMEKNTQWEEKCIGKGVKRLSRKLLLVRGVLVKIVGHEENIGSRWDEGMAWFHNLKAQITEGTH